MRYRSVRRDAGPSACGCRPARGTSPRLDLCVVPTSSRSTDGAGAGIAPGFGPRAGHEPWVPRRTELHRSDARSTWNTLASSSRPCASGARGPPAHGPAPLGGAREPTHAGSVGAWRDRESAASASSRSPPDPEPARRASGAGPSSANATHPSDQGDRPSRATTSPDAEEPALHASGTHAAPTGHTPHRLGIPAARADELPHVAAWRWRLPEHDRVSARSRGSNCAADSSPPFLYLRTTSLRAAERSLPESTRGRSLSGPASRRLLPKRVVSLSSPASPPRTARAPRPPSPRSARRRRRRRARPSARTGSSDRATPRRRTTAPPRSPPRPP